MLMQYAVLTLHLEIWAVSSSGCCAEVRVETSFGGFR